MSVTGGIGKKIGQVKRYWPGKAPEWKWGAEADEDFDIRSACVIKSLAQAFPPVGDSDEDALEEKRRRIREKLLQRQQEEETGPLELELEEESEEESEYETDSEDDDVGGVALAKPVFVPKSDIIGERERVEAEERALEEDVRRRMEERKLETKQIVVEKIREEQEMAVEEDEANTDDDDKMNEGEEYERWKAREIGRIKKDREDREAIERREWERKRKIPKQLQAAAAAAPKHKQKHQKGAFFQEDADR